jgi:hypothetical protein
MLYSAVSASSTHPLLLTFVTKRNSLRHVSVYDVPSFAVPMTWSNTAAAKGDAGTRRGITTLCRHLEPETETDGRSLAAELGHAVRLVHWTGMWQRRGKVQRT